MGEPGKTTKNDKPVSLEETDSDSNDKSIMETKEVSEPTAKDDEPKLMTETEIKQEIISSDEEGSEYTSDGDGSDDVDAKRLVIDESGSSKTNKKADAKTATSTGNKKIETAVVKSSGLNGGEKTTGSASNVKKAVTAKKPKEPAKSPAKAMEKVPSKSPVVPDHKKPAPSKAVNDEDSDKKAKSDKITPLKESNKVDESLKSEKKLTTTSKTALKSDKIVSSKSTSEKINDKPNNSKRISDESSKSTPEKKTDKSRDSKQATGSSTKRSSEKKTDKPGDLKRSSDVSPKCVSDKPGLSKSISEKKNDKSTEGKDQNVDNTKSTPVKTPKEKSTNTKPKISETENSLTTPEATCSTNGAAKVVVKSEHGPWITPFDEGWRREVVFRGTNDPSQKKKPSADVYYFAPCGTKLRSMPEIMSYLNNNNKGGLGLVNFTFMKEAIYHPPQEQTRQAAQRSLFTTKSTPKVKIQRPIKITPSATPSTPSTPSAVVEDVVSPQELGPPTDADGQPILGAKRWRKRKALPPDFLHTEQALSQRGPKEPIRIQVSATPSKATTSKSLNLISPPVIKAEDAKASGRGIRVLKRKILVSTDLMSNMVMAKKPRLMMPPNKSTTSESSSSAAAKAHSPNKVVFTFSRMSSGPITAQSNNSMFTLVRVNPLQTPCTLSCPGLQGQVPDLHCSVCLLLFHSQCVGTTKDFVCQRCKKQKTELVKLEPKSDVNGTPALTNGDATHKPEAPDHIKVQTPPEVDEEINTNGDAPIEEELEDADLASDDDDDNFMTVTPEVVMSPSTPLKDHSNDDPNVAVSKVFIPGFNPPLPPLIRAPTTSPVKSISQSVAPVYPQCLPRLTAPSALVRPMITLTPPYGAASNQLRTLVQQLPPRPIVSQPIGTSVSPSVTTPTRPLVTTATSFIAPLVTPPSVPVNLLSNSSPIIVGSQVLTPVSISMPGIAKGTVIYTNNPTLRFLLPSSGGMQTFTPSKPVAATPPKDSAVTTSTTTTISSPIVSTSEPGVTVASKMLVQKPPLVVNMRGKSLCSLILQVGKAESGQAVKLIDSDTDPVDEVSTEKENVEEPANVDPLSQDTGKQTGDEQPMEQDVQQDSGASSMLVGDAPSTDSDSKQPTESTDSAETVPIEATDSAQPLPSEPAGSVPLLSTEPADSAKPLPTEPIVSAQPVPTESADSVPPLPTEPEDSVPSLPTDSADSVPPLPTEPAESIQPSSNQLENFAVSDKLNTEGDNAIIDVDPSAVTAGTADSLSEIPVVDSVVASAVIPEGNSTKEPPKHYTLDSTKETSGTDLSEESMTVKNEEPALPGDTNATITAREQSTINPVPEVAVPPVDSTTMQSSDLTKGGASTTETKEAPPAEMHTEDESPEESPILGPFSPIFTEEELIDWDRESVSSNDDEEEYRPKSPIIMCAQPFPDGYTRLRSTALSNRGAELSCPRGNCARVSCYRRPVLDLYADQEHAYSSPRSRQRFKQAGRKRMMTLLPPKRAYHRLQGSCDAFSNIFDYLSTADLLRASRVCRMWRKLASQPHQWATVRLKGLKVNNWKTCAKNLEFYGTTMLDMNGFEQSPTSWHQFLSHAHHLRKLQALVFGSVPAWVLHSVAMSLPQLLCLEAEYIDVATPPLASIPTSTASDPEKGEDLVPTLDVGWWAALPHLTVLRVRAPRGMTPAPFAPQGNFKALSSLASLTHLSLTSLRSFPYKEVEFLERLPQLQVLELGQCKDWNDQTFQRLGKLRSLRRLRLELGGAQGDRGLANALGHMPKLEELTLLSFKITTSLAASIRRLKHLWHLTIWPDMSAEGAMIVYNTLQAVRSLKKLMSFSWGIIFTENPKTRYSRKSTKHREAQDVNEWWSKELRNVHRAKSIKIPLLKAFSDETSKSKGGAAAPNNSMEQGLIGVGHLKHKLTKCLPDVEIYVYQVPETLLANVYGVTR